MASIHKRNGTPYFHAAYRDSDGARKLRSTGTGDKKLAQRIADEYEQAAKQGRDQRLTMKRVRDVLNDIYLKVHEEELPNDQAGEFFTQWVTRKESELAASSYTDYKQTAEDFIAFIGSRKSKPLDAISGKIVTDYRDHLLKRVTVGTARKKIKILRAAFNDAVSEGRARENPANNVKLQKNQGRARSALSSEQINSLMAVANAEWQGMILTAYHTGLRLGDIASLDWDNVLLGSNEIRVTATKTGSDMNPPISNQLHKCLVSLPSYDRGGKVFPEASVIYARAGSSSLSNQFRRIMVDAGLAEADSHENGGKGRKAKRTVSKYSFHCLRHSFVSELKNSGAGDSIAKELAGHSSDAVSQIYTHTDSKLLRKAVNRLPEVTIPTKTTK